jgi:hypothetical protein
MSAGNRQGVASMTLPSHEHDLCQKARLALLGSVIYSLHNLEVEQLGDDLVVTGTVESYYHKQMAQETIRAEMPTARLINSVSVE